MINHGADALPFASHVSDEDVQWWIVRCRTRAGCVAHRGFFRKKPPPKLQGSSQKYWPNCFGNMVQP